MNEQQINGEGHGLLRNSLLLAWLIIRGVRNVFFLPVSDSGFFVVFFLVFFFHKNI